MISGSRLDNFSQNGEKPHGGTEQPALCRTFI